MLQILFYLTIALHVSGIIITHFQEHKTTVITASGNGYTAFVCSVWTSQQSANFSLYNIKTGFYNRGRERLLRGTV
jgi:hypothetical protein